MEINRFIYYLLMLLIALGAVKVRLSVIVVLCAAVTFAHIFMPYSIHDRQFSLLLFICWLSLMVQVAQELKKRKRVAKSRGSKEAG